MHTSTAWVIALKTLYFFFFFFCLVFLFLFLKEFLFVDVFKLEHVLTTSIYREIFETEHIAYRRHFLTRPRPMGVQFPTHLSHRPFPFALLNHVLQLCLFQLCPVDVFCEFLPRYWGEYSFPPIDLCYANFGRSGTRDAALMMQDEAAMVMWCLRRGIFWRFRQEAATMNRDVGGRLDRILWFIPFLHIASVFNISCFLSAGWERECRRISDRWWEGTVAPRPLDGCVGFLDSDWIEGPPAREEGWHSLRSQFQQSIRALDSFLK